MVSALSMLRRLSRPFRYAVREDELQGAFGARGAWLAVATRATTGVSDPDAAWGLAFVEMPERAEGDPARDGPAPT
jgi:hypothetical protein